MDFFLTRPMERGYANKMGQIPPRRSPCEGIKPFGDCCKMTELWKQCADWLCRMDILPNNHRITWPDAKIQDLAYTLRDGVLLCHIAKALDESSLDLHSAHLRPQMAQFLCLKNIRLFLQSCLDKFGLEETDLFHPTMLYDYSDFARVLHTLSKLSNCAKAKAKEVNGFPQQYKEPSQDEEQIYRTLEDMVNEDNYKAFYYDHHGAESAYGKMNRPYYSEGQKDEDIYEDLCYFKTSSSKPTQMEWNFQPKERRDYCIKELVDTEINYVEVLNMLRKNFIKDLKTIKDSDRKTIFMNIEELGKIHSAFRQYLIEAMTMTSSKKIGEIFIEYKKRFLKYGDYCSDLPKAQEALDALLNKAENVRDEITQCEQNANEGKFRLRDLLAVPMQRILKYHLLLRELLSNTPSTHEEHHTLKQAYEAMLDVSDFINEVKRDSEQLGIINEIESSITDWNLPEGVCLKDYGRLLSDGELKVQSHDTNGKTKLRFVFVFDKIILMCKATRGDHYAYKNSLKLSDYRVEQDNIIRRLGRDSRWGYNFILVHKDNITAYTMFTKKEEDKNRWVTALKEAHSNIFPNKSYHSTHNALMHTFDSPTSCSYCHKLLKGLFFQGFKCEKCQKAMHKECIALLSKCGPSQPPSLPPRPPSMQLPQPLLSLSNRFSNCSLDDSLVSLRRQSSLISVASLPPPKIPPPVLITNGSNPDYINTNITDHPWYEGEMEREAANLKLSRFPLATFLVRLRVQNGEKLGYALSLKVDDDVKHMKICTSVDGDNSYQYHLSDKRKFGSIVELITYYSRNSLKESFTGLDKVLQFPIGEVSRVVASYDFQPDVTDCNMLPMKTGDEVVIIDKYGDSQGWWKACFNGKVGFVPKNFVEELSDDDPNSKETASLNESHDDEVATTSTDVEGTL